MLNRKKPESQGGMEQAIDSARQAASPKQEVSDPEIGDNEYSFISLRVRRGEYKKMKKLLGEKCIPIARAARMSLFYVIRGVELGELEISEGGIRNIRRER